jgi:hypothetical protein
MSCKAVSQGMFFIALRVKKSWHGTNLQFPCRLWEDALMLEKWLNGRGRKREINLVNYIVKIRAIFYTGL